jgi:hypothetical protein
MPLKCSHCGVKTSHAYLRECDGIHTDIAEKQDMWPKPHCDAYWEDDGWRNIYGRRWPYPAI